MTKKFLHHEWAEGTSYINLDEVANNLFGDWNSQEAVINAANYCSEWRERCLNEKSFVFELVLSAEDKMILSYGQKNQVFSFVYFSSPQTALQSMPQELPVV